MGSRPGVRCAHFRVLGRFDGSDVATVTIEHHDPARAFLRVRPLRRRRAFELPLAEVARGLIYDVIKRELAEKRRAKAAARRGR